MRILITGATGFIGRALIMRLRRDGHEIVALVRSLPRGRTLLGQEAELLDSNGPLTDLTAALSTCAAVINLAGEPLFSKRWTASYKQTLRNSRLALTQQLVAAMGSLSTPKPRVLVSASAIGYYGTDGQATVDESSLVGDDFLAHLCRDWEAQANMAEALGVRVVNLRIGLVLGLEGGMLARLQPLSSAGLGATLGTGKQWMSWIHLNDLVEIIAQALVNEDLHGPVNATAPNPVNNQAFTQQLAKALKTTARFKIPGMLLKCALGEAAQFVLTGQKVLPKQLQRRGFQFTFEHLADALHDLFDTSLISIEPLATQTCKPMAHPHVKNYLPTHPPRFVLQTQTLIEQPIHEVFQFFCRAENLGLLTPMALALKIAKPIIEPLQAGAFIDYTFSIAGLLWHWQTQICHWEPPKLFVDAQTTGPYKSWWHEHHFIDHGSTTIVVDKVFYTPPYGPLGLLLQKFFIEQQLKRIFHFRAQHIRLRFGSNSFGSNSIEPSVT